MTARSRQKARPGFLFPAETTGKGGVMKMDMHYYGVYVLARSAGLSPEASGIIAMASQYVDDSVSANTVTNENGCKLQTETTAHNMISLDNVDVDNQRQVWVPFHFLPGGEGDELSDKLVCRKDSPIARAMVDHYLDATNADFYLELIGVMAHVYADTFSHHGFSGISSRRNRVKGGSLKCHNAENLVGGDILHRLVAGLGILGGLLPNFKAAAGAAAEISTGALGHGAVVTYPDLPYLQWSFAYEKPELTEYGTIQRDNPRDFMDACLALHSVFARVGENMPRHRSGAIVPFEELTKVLQEIIRNEAAEKELCQSWRKAVKENRFGFSAGDEQIYAYETVKNSWDRQIERFATAPDTSGYLSNSLFRFQQAASYHRNYVLRWLLPSRGMMVI